MSEPTAGPWVVVRDNGDGRVCVESRDRTVADCGTAGSKVSAVNARLIAAAPDLLSALKGLLAHSDSWHIVETAGGDIARARAAIAKAEGNQS